MSDDLLTRIAAALTAHQRRDSQFCICGWGQLGKSHADHQADAVIRDLGLRQETEPANKYRGQSTRVVSDRR